MIEPIFVDAKDLEPGQWGVCIRENGIVTSLKVLRDLPEPMRDFLIAHEQGHSIDPEKNFWIIDELQANWYAIRRYPAGGLMVIVGSLFLPSRISYYVRRWKNKGD